MYFSECFCDHVLPDLVRQPMQSLSYSSLERCIEFIVHSTMGRKYVLNDILLCSFLLFSSPLRLGSPEKLTLLPCGRSYLFDVIFK